MCTRWIGAFFLGVVALLPTAAVAFADNPVPPINKAADEVLAAIAGKDEAALRTLAAKDKPDPWTVAHVLCLRGELDAAAAFAKAAPRVDVEKLPAYVESLRNATLDTKCFEALPAVVAALDREDAKAAHAILETLELPEGRVFAEILRYTQAYAIRLEMKLGEAHKRFMRVSRSCLKLGWHARAWTAADSAAWCAQTAGNREALIKALMNRGEVAATRGMHDEAAASYLNAGFIHSQAGRHEASGKLAKQGLVYAERAKADQWKGTAHLLIGNGQRQSGDLRAALASYERGAPLLEKSNPIGHAGAVVNIGMVLADLGEFERARPHYERGLKLATTAGHPPFVANATGGLARVYSELGAYEKAKPLFERAIRLFTTVRDPLGLANALDGLARLHMVQGESRAAVATFEKLLPVARQLGQTKRVAGTLIDASSMYLRLRDVAKALDHAERGTKLAREADVRSYVANGLLTIGEAKSMMSRFDEAQKALEESLAIKLELDEKEGAAIVLGALADLAGMQTDFEGAIAYANRARELSDTPQRTEVHARILLNAGRLDEALELLEALVKRYEEEEHNAGLGRVLTQIGTIRNRQARSENALASFRRALPLQEAAKNTAGSVRALDGIGHALHRLSEFAAARDAYKQALALIETDDALRPLSAQVLSDLGSAYTQMGDHVNAIACQRDAVKLNENNPDKTAYGGSLLNLAVAHARADEHGEALGHLDEALRVFQERKYAPGIARTYGTIGSVHVALGSYASAIRYQTRALESMRKGEDKDAMAATLVNLGLALAGSGDTESAIERLREGHALAEEIGNRQHAGAALGNLGTLASHDGRHAEARRHFASIIEVAEAIGDRRMLVRSLVNMGSAYLAEEDTTNAQIYAKRSYEVMQESGFVDPLAVALRGAVELELGHPEDALQYTREAANLAMRQNARLSDELSAAGRDRWTSLLETGLAAAQAAGDAAGAFALLEETRAGSLLESLGNTDVLQRAHIPSALITEEREARAEVVAKEAALARAFKRGKRRAIRAARKALAEAQTASLAAVERIQRRAKSAANLVYPQAVDIDAFRATLGPKDVFVSYAVVEPAVVLVVTRGETRFVDLGDPELIEAAIDRLQVDDTEVSPSAAVAELRKLLIDPLGLPADMERLLVMPHGRLTFVPFALLATDVAVAYVPSASTHRLLLTSEDRSGPGKRVLAVGDPDYAGRSLSPLPATRAEVEAVGDVKLLGSDAEPTRLKEVLGTEKHWRAIHFACHGLVNERKPKLSALALTKGDLTTAEVLGLRMPADLVTLSACQSGRGRVYHAEGVLGFTRGFMLAGSPRVIASLWNVDDASTCALMTKFYERWKAGAAPATALREAQLFIAAQPKWRHPYYWAAWQLWGLPD